MENPQTEEVATRLSDNKDSISQQHHSESLCVQNVLITLHTENKENKRKETHDTPETRSSDVHQQRHAKPPPYSTNKLPYTLGQN